MNPENWVLIISLLLFLYVKISTSLDTLKSKPVLERRRPSRIGGRHFRSRVLQSRKSHSQLCRNMVQQALQKNRSLGRKQSQSPVNRTSGVLSINGDGNLILQENKNQPFLISQTNIKTTNCSAQLLDTGNLILFHNDESGKSVMAWQSFDYPTHTQLPEMKLGLDRRTSLDRVLTSSKSQTDPGVGEYSYRVDPDGLPQLVVNRGSERRWRSIPWMGSRWIGNEATGSSFLFKARFVDNEDEVSEAYSVEKDSIMWKFLDQSGTIRMMRWMERDRRWGELLSLPKERCDSYGCCGPFGYCDSNKW